MAVLTTERHRSADHNTLDHGERIMAGLTNAVRAISPTYRWWLLSAKGGITWAEVARTGEPPPRSCSGRFCPACRSGS